MNRCGLTRATVKVEEGSLGHIRRYRLPRSFRPQIAMTSRTRDILDRRIQVALAGMAAERKFVGRSRRNWIGGGQDMETVRELAESIYDGERHRTYLKFMIAEVDHLVEQPETWAQIEAVAEALMNRQTLSGTEVRAICLAAKGNRERIKELRSEQKARYEAEQLAWAREAGIEA